MSNLEKSPDELLVGEVSTSSTNELQILEPRDVPLGGPRAMGVRRTLPQRARSLIGGWCFVDNYGPERVSMDVPPHPHTGLQTVSWLFSGEIEHGDSVGSHAVVRPGVLNLMTAGRGISHSEVSLPSSGRGEGPSSTRESPPVLHGAQLWIALPDEARGGEPFFESFTPVPFALGAATVSVFIGSLAGSTSTARVFSELVGAQIDLPAGTSVTLPVDPRFEHGVLVDAGDASLGGIPIPVSHLAYLPTGAEHLELAAGADAVRVLLIGGVPLGEQIVMWWNFIGRDHDEIVQFRDDWQRDVVGGGSPVGRFGTVEGYEGRPLPAPELPGIRLKPRG